MVDDTIPLFRKETDMADDDSNAGKPDVFREKRSRMTAELLEALRDAKTIQAFAEQHSSDYTDMNVDQYLSRLLAAKKLKKAEVINTSSLNKIYGYQIFSGIKNPSRDKLLAIAVAMKLSLEECQQLLRLARVNELYAKNKRDSIIIFGLMKQLDITELNDLLFDMEEFVLQ